MRVTALKRLGTKSLIVALLLSLIAHEAAVCAPAKGESPAGGKGSKSAPGSKGALRGTGAIAPSGRTGGIAPSGRTGGKVTPAWSLSMHSDFYGDLAVLVSIIGMKFTSEKSGITIVALPPDGRVVAFNPETKKRFDTSADKYGKQHMDRAATSRQEPVWQLIGTDKLAGLNVKKYRNFKDGELKGMLDARRQAVMRNLDPQFVAVPEEIWISTDIQLPVSFMNLLRHIIRLDTSQLARLTKNQKTAGSPIPLRVYRFTGLTKKIPVLDTLTCKKTTATKPDFTPPPGMKQVTSEMALLFDDEDTENMDLFGGGGAIRSGGGISSGSRGGSGLKRTPVPVKKQ